MKFYISTLGCKANQADSDSIASFISFVGGLVVKVADEADIAIVNTCAVTSKASYQSRQMIRRLTKKGIRVIVIGCDVRYEKDAISVLEGVEAFENIDETFRYISSLVKEDKDRDKRPKGPSRARPFLKIQNGCDSFCSYCIVPYLRGAPSSLPPHEVIEKIKGFEEDGFYEVVLTGIHIGRYGRDMGLNLASLLRSILCETNIPRIRLSSIEPDEVTDEILEIISSSGGRICPHLHIPLQSGSDKILRLMNRRYTSQDFYSLIHRITERLPSVSIGTDIITGFPGETEKELKETYDMIEQLPISYLHVFTFSPRRGTLAERLPDQVPERIRKERTLLFRSLSRRKRIEYLSRRVGGIADVVFDLAKGDTSKRARKGVSEDYITVLVKDHGGPLENHALVRLEEISGECVLGSIL